MKACAGIYVAHTGEKVPCHGPVQATLTIGGVTKGVCENCYWALLARADKTAATGKERSA